MSDLVQSLDAGVSVNSEDREPIGSEFSILKTSCVTSGIFLQQERKAVTEAIEISRLKEPLLDNSIIISRMNTPLLVGANAYVKNAPKNTFLPDRLWQVKIHQHLVNMDWLSQWFSNERNFEKIRNLATGTSNSMKNITKPDVMAFYISAPDMPEQTKIANFLTAIDEKITQLTQKYDLLTQYKKGVMQQIFSQKLRFKDDGGQEFPVWKNKRLGEVCKPQQWITISISDLCETGFPVYGANGLIGYFNSYNHECETVAITCRGATCGEVNLIPAKSYITGNSMCLDDINQVLYDYKFIYYAMRFRGFKDVISGSAQPQIVGSMIRKVEFMLPALAEQTKIANFLTAIDDKITHTRTQLDAVKLYKKGLLQQLFV